MGFSFDESRGVLDTAAFRTESVGILLELSLQEVDPIFEVRVRFGSASIKRWRVLSSSLR